MIEIELPYPLSVNHYYQRTKKGMMIKPDGKVYRNIVHLLLLSNGVKPIKGNIHMIVDVYPPDNRKRDIDNIQKCLWDALQHGGAFHDDSQIKDFECHMHESLPPNGKVVVKLEEKIEVQVSDI